jgi:hypothetical protein
MHYRRVIGRNDLAGDYDGSGTPKASMSGDLRRLEADQLDSAHLPRYAAAAGISEEAVATVLRTFLGLPEPGCEECEKSWSSDHRCVRHGLYGTPIRPPKN